MSRLSLYLACFALTSLPLGAAPPRASAHATAPAAQPAAAAAQPAAAPAQVAPAGAAPIPDPPSVEARAYILIDNDSDRVLAESHADDRSEPASLTKVMTSYAVFAALKEGRLKLTDMVTI